MSYRLRQYEADYRNTLSTGFFVSIALHLGFACLGAVLVVHARSPDRPRLLGYRGPTHTLEELEILEPNSVQSYFSQRRREGRRVVPEYEIRHKVVEEPGPNPILVREEKRKPEPRPEPQPSSEEFDLIQPTLPMHRELSYSEDYVILKTVVPAYPEYELERHIEAQVVVAFYVTAEGEISDVQVTQSAALPQGSSAVAFELAALEAVRQWQVQPARRDGKPLGQWLYLRISFDDKGVEFGGRELSP